MNTGTPNSVTTPASAAEAINKVERKRSNDQQSENAGSLEPGPHLAPPGKGKDPETGKVFLPVEGAPVENIGENVNNAASKDKGPPLDAIPSGREPAAKTIPERNDPYPNQGGLDAPGNIGINKSDKNVAVYSESFELFGCGDKMPKIVDW